MREPFRPSQEDTIDQDPSRASGAEPPRDAAAEIKGARLEPAPHAVPAGSDPERRPYSPAEIARTLADGTGPEPAEVLAETLADSAGMSPVESADSHTFKLAPREPADSNSDPGEAEAPPRLDQVAGYKILKVLGQGGMGVVYKARQRGLKRIVALKMISGGVGREGPDDLARFRSEAMAVADLQHPNIVQIYEVGEDNGRPFFSLEYVSGGSLAKKISGTPRPPDEAARMLKALADGMRYAHERGIVHRD